MNAQQVRNILAGISDENPVWLAMNAILEDAESNEVNALCVPGLTDGDSHFNRGRLSAIRDLKGALRQLKVERQSNA